MTGLTHAHAGLADLFAPGLRVLAEILDRTDAAIWIYHFKTKRVIWANRAALEVWKADSIEDLRARDLSVDMSRSVEQRLDQYCEDFERRGSTFYERWTLFPRGEPRTLRVKYSGIKLDDGSTAMLCEANEAERSEPEAVRSVEALLHTTVMISMFTADGAPLYCNPAARSCYGRTDRELIEHFADPAEGHTFVESLLADGRKDVTVRVANRDGAERWHRIIGIKCADAVTGETALLLSESDVTEVQEAQHLLEASRNEALKANNLKSKFIANMSHEIRTPLNGVIGMAQILKKTALNEDQSWMIDTVLSSGETLLLIINDVLDISRIESGLIEVKNESFGVDDLVAKSFASVRGAAEMKGIAVRAESGFEPEARLFGDPNLLRQVLVNLLGNAIKFSPAGTVTLRARPDGQNRVRFEVSDQGPGIPVEEHTMIFERFQKGTRPREFKSLGGTGLGLSIARDLVHLLGGEIGVESTPGAGATFWLTVPLGLIGDALPRERESERAPLARPLSGRVLVVEDNATNAQIFALALRSLALEVEILREGIAASEVLAERPFDLVVLDLQLPGQRGDEVLRQLRGSSSPNAEVPVVMVTADATPEAYIEALDAGASSVMTKPFSVDEFLDLVQSVLEPSSPEPARAGARA